MPAKQAVSIVFIKISGFLMISRKARFKNPKLTTTLHCVARSKEEVLLQSLFVELSTTRKALVAFSVVRASNFLVLERKLLLSCKMVIFRHLPPQKNDHCCLLNRLVSAL